MLAQFGKDRLVSDLQPDDFLNYRRKLAQRLKTPASLTNAINRASIVFNFAYPIGPKNAHKPKLIDRPVNFGFSFERPSATAFRKDRNAAGVKLFEREEVLAILDACDVQMRAMAMLGLNGALGNSDIANLPLATVNVAIESGWLVYPRVKTAINRRIPLWGETLDAIRTALAARPAPRDATAQGLAFLTREGRAWVRMGEAKEAPEGKEQPPAVPIDVLSREFAKILRKLKINGRRGLGFYALRHCFQTYAGECKDETAISSIMGHIPQGMSAHYRHGVSDQRLRAVCECVRQWLFPSPLPGENREGGAS